MNWNHKIAVFTVGLLGLVAGCASGPSIVGTWTTGDTAETTLVIKADGSYTTVTAGKKGDGTWHTDGNSVTLYQDLRNGGTPAQFGGDWDGAFRYQLDPSGQSMTSVAPSESNPVPTVTLHKKS